jgi:hypothetical protein
MLSSNRALRMALPTTQTWSRLNCWVTVSSWLAFELGAEAGLGAGEVGEIKAQGFGQGGQGGLLRPLLGLFPGRARGEIAVGQGDEAVDVRQQFEQLREQARPHSPGSPMLVSLMRGFGRRGLVGDGCDCTQANILRRAGRRLRTTATMLASRMAVIRPWDQTQ